MRGTEASVVEAILTLLEEGSHYGTDAQHKLYFMAELSGESFGHEPHLYGPHSSMVSNQLGALVAAGLVDERVSANLHPPAGIWTPLPQVVQAFRGRRRDQRGQA